MHTIQVTLCLSFIGKAQILQLEKKFLRKHTKRSICCTIWKPYNHYTIIYFRKGSCYFFMSFIFNKLKSDIENNNNNNEGGEGWIGIDVKEIECDISPTTKRSKHCFDVTNFSCMSYNSDSSLSSSSSMQSSSSLWKLVAQM